jgi:hypothetical protein
MPPERSSILVSSLLCALLALAPEAARADASVRVVLDWGDPGTPTYDETQTDPARVEFGNADNVATAGELRFADAGGIADATKMKLRCDCDAVESPQARCESTVVRDDFVVTGGPLTSVIATFSMRVRGTPTFPIVGAEPFPSDTIFFRVDPVGPGSRTEYVQIAGQIPTVAEIGQVDVLTSTQSEFDAIVRRSKSVPVGTPFSLEASLRTICQVAPGGVENGHASIENAMANWLGVTLPNGYQIAPEPDTSAATLSALATLLGVARRRS